MNHKSDKIKMQALALADATFTLLAKCQEKEARVAIRFNLTQAEFRCLRYCKKGEKLHNNEISHRMNLSAGRTTQIIDGLVKKDLFQREIDETNRRSMILTLTDKGIDLIEEMNTSFIDIHAEILESVDDDQRMVVVESIRQLINALNIWFSKD